MNGPIASVIIPAYNEGAVIERCLRSLTAEMLPGPVEIVVAANGCTDDTVARAQAFDGVVVLDLPTPGKVGALNAADDVATVFPRIYLDADVELSPGTLGELIGALTFPEARCAAPQLTFDLTACSWPVRAFHQVFSRLPSAQDTLVGRGVYGLSRSGRERFGVFPQVQGDDLFVGRLFAPEEHLCVPGSSVIRPPQDLRSLLQVRTRVARGNEQLAQATPAGLSVAEQAPADFSSSTARTGRALAGLAYTEPRTWPALGVYVTVTAVARWRAHRTRQSTSTWNRDHSTR
ncbi:glycosyltransferase [Austwickia chelonae]|uniref:glycosyltransferase n=1 Tax=Austwickia chelonae TaxID=100225 RepID=UPI000E27182D|nr:glycosyltransferase family 2 protein [Austwickia chelonae]